MSINARVLRAAGASLVTAGVLLAVPAGSPTIAQTVPATDAVTTSAPVLQVVGATDVDIFLEWTEVRRANNYFVFFDDNETPFIVGDRTEFTVHFNRAIGMVPGSTHTFRVATQYDGGGAVSNEVTATFLPGDNESPTAPGNLRVVSNTADGVVLAWDPSIDESKIKSYFVNGGPCSPISVSATSTTPAPTSVGISSIDIDPVCGLEPGFEYSFSVRARDALNNDSPSSNTVTVVLPPSQ